MMTNAEALEFLESRKTVVDGIEYPNGYELHCFIDSFEEDETGAIITNIKYRVEIECVCKRCSAVATYTTNKDGYLVFTGNHSDHYAYVEGRSTVSLAEKDTGIWLALQEALQAAERIGS